MAKYEVITIAISVKNNRIAKFGETVHDSELTVNANALVEAGCLKLIEADKVEEKTVNKETATEEVVALEVVVEDATIVEEALATEEVVEVKKAQTAAEKASKK
jgi:hypothetical protein